MKIPPFLALSLGFTALAAAQPVALYEFTNNSSIPTTFGGVTATAFSKNPQLINAIANNNLFSVSPDDDASSPSLAVVTQQYFQFTVTPPPGRPLTFEALVFDAARQGANTPGRGWVLRSSRDNFAADLATQAVPGPAPAFTTFRVDLPAAAFSAVSDPVTFRVYTYAAAALEFVDYDNFKILATIGQPVTDTPPQVRVSGPRRIVTSRARLTIRGSATDDKAVTRVTVGGRMATGTTQWSAAVPLRFGPNVLRIVATDTAGQSSPPVTVRVRRSR